MVGCQGCGEVQCPTATVAIAPEFSVAKTKTPFAAGHGGVSAEIRGVRRRHLQGIGFHQQVRDLQGSQVPQLEPGRCIPMDCSLPSAYRYVATQEMLINFTTTNGTYA